MSAGRGRRVSLVFSMQGVGLLAAPLVVLVLLLVSGAGQYNTVWRVSLALGAVPGVIMIYFRFRMKETAAFSAAKDASDTALAEERRTRAAAWLAHRWDLLATAGNWFIFDVVFYSNSLFSSQLTKQYITKPADSTGPVSGAAVPHRRRVVHTVSRAVCAAGATMGQCWSSIDGADASCSCSVSGADDGHTTNRSTATRAPI